MSSLLWQLLFDTHVLVYATDFVVLLLSVSINVTFKCKHNMTRTRHTTERIEKGRNFNSHIREFKIEKRIASAVTQEENRLQRVKTTMAHTRYNKNALFSSQNLKCRGQRRGITSVRRGGGISLRFDEDSDEEGMCVQCVRLVSLRFSYLHVMNAFIHYVSIPCICLSQCSSTL